jgi:glycosyltransferase involved in cell wall biosynthesis
MSLRIGAFFQHVPPFPGAGSLRAKSIVSALALSQQGYAVHATLFTPVSQPEMAPQIDIVNIAVANVENAQGLAARVRGETKLGLAAAWQIFRRSRDLDMLVISTPAYLTALTISWFARLARLPYIIELRDIYPQVYAESGLLASNNMLFRFLSRASRKMYLNSALTITATKGLEHDVLAEAPGAKVISVYNGFPSEFFDITVPKRPRFTVCFHGVLGYFQNMPAIIELAALLEPYQIDVLVIGYGKQAYLAEQCTLPNFIFRGKLPFAQTIEEIAQCHLGLCLRNDDEISRNAFPVKVWEYLGLAIPSIVTPHCEAGIFLEEKGCGFQFNADEVGLIAEKIRHLAGNDEVMNALTENCQQERLSYTREAMGRIAADMIVRAIDSFGGTSPGA